MSIMTELSDFDWQVRHTIYTHFARTASSPSMDDIAGAVGATENAACASVEKLAEAHVITLAPASRRIWMAHPFSAVPTAYPVVTAGLRYWANCAWDVFGIAALIGERSVTTSECSNSCRAIRLEITPDGGVIGEGVVHYLVPPRRFWENIGFT